MGWCCLDHRTTTTTTTAYGATEDANVVVVVVVEWLELRLGLLRLVVVVVVGVLNNIVDNVSVVVLYGDGRPRGSPGVDQRLS